jgi:hypothetical protein
MDIPLMGKKDPVEPTLNAVKMDTSMKMYLEKRKTQSPVPFIGETFGGLNVPSNEGP